MKEPINATSAGLAMMCAALWGGVVVAVKYSEDTLPPITVAAVRFGLAAIFMLGWCGLRGRPMWLKRQEAPLAFTVACLLLIQILLFNFAIHWSNSSHGALLISTFIFWVALIEHFFTGMDRLTTRKVLGMVLAAAGVALTLFRLEDAGLPVDTEANTDVPTVVGDALMLLSGLMLGIKIVFTKYAVSKVHPEKLILWHHLFGTLLFVVVALLVEGIPDDLQRVLTRPVVLSLMYQGLIVGGVCFAVQAVLLRRHTATSISVFSFATPVFGVVAALAFRGDPYSTWLLFAGVCVAIGIYLVTVNQNPPATSSND